MTKKIIIFLLVNAVLVSVQLAEAQQPKKIPRIGVLSPGSASSGASRIKALRQGLRELGYVEGENILIEYRYAEGKFDRLPDLAAELLRLKLNVIVVAGSSAVRAARKATSTIPIVIGNSSDPVASGFVASLARPGGNITGLSLVALELTGKRLELLKESVPNISRVAMLWNPEAAGPILAFKEAQAVSPVLGLQLQSLEVRTPDDFESMFRAAARGRNEALIVQADGLINSHRTRIVDLAAKNRLPAIYTESEYVNVGGLMFYGPSITDLWRRAATYVDKILKGTKPADLPVEQPTKFEFVINLKTAKQIGLTIPPNVLARADRVIK
jgi:putative ABC transport system substrate-binding protein